MKIVINNEKTKNKELIFYENPWTAKRKICYDGTMLENRSKNVFEHKQGKNIETFEIQGNSSIGMVLKMFGQDVELVRKLAWWEILLGVLPFVCSLIFCFINNTSAGVFMSSISGGICGGFGGGLSYFSCCLMRKTDKLYFKIIFALLIALISFFTSYIFAVLIFHVCLLF